MPHTNCCACTCLCPFVACFVSTDTLCVWGAGGDTTVRVWRASDLSLVRVLRGHRGSVLTLLAVGSVLLSGSRDNTIRYAIHATIPCRRAGLLASMMAVSMDMAWGLVVVFIHTMSLWLWLFWTPCTAASPSCESL
jgi:hypothetical protein